MSKPELSQVILGMLRYRSLTIYELRAGLQKSVGYFFSASFGSLHPALQKLEAQGAVTATNSVDKGRAKKTYTLTAKGRDVLRQWLMQDIELGSIQDWGLLRLFFMTEIPREDRAAILGRYIAAIRQQERELEQIRSSYRIEDAPREHREALRYRLATLNYGLAFHRFQASWFEAFLEDVVKKGESS